jgi:hypothetical protein
MIRTSHAKNSTIPGMAYPLMVLALATNASYPRIPDLIDRLTEAIAQEAPLLEADAPVVTQPRGGTTRAKTASCPARPRATPGGATGCGRETGRGCRDEVFLMRVTGVASGVGCGVPGGVGTEADADGLVVAALFGVGDVGQHP